MPRKRSTLLKTGAVLVGLAGVALLYRMLPVGAWLTTFRTWVGGLGPTGYAVYALVYAACIVLFVPASILTLGAGLLFGVARGTVIVVIGASLGAALSFLLARTILRHRIEAMTAGNAKFRALDRAISREGGKIVLLVRLAVIFPFTYTNYAFGLTGVRFGPYVVTTLLGIIPGTLAFVYIGALANEAATASRARVIVYAVGAVLAIIVSLFVGRIATRAIREAGVGDESG
jgi:uncharacterized membrane protein YdjX (TVP38/TMEM64 family)